ncbi:MAG: segregation/condensation protein A, partial [Micromonosporaceae bacterium]
HAGKVSVREQAAVLRVRLAERTTATFGDLIADCEHTMQVVGRFLALLELYREGVVGFDQAQPLGDLTVRWTGARDWSASFEVDEYAGAPAEGVAESRSPAPAETEPDQPEPTETGSAGAAAGGVTPQPTDHGAEPGTPPSDGAETPQPRGEQT